MYIWAYTVGQATRARGVSILRLLRSSAEARHLSNIGYVRFLSVAIVTGHAKLVTTVT